MYAADVSQSRAANSTTLFHGVVGDPTRVSCKDVTAFKRLPGCPTIRTGLVECSELLSGKALICFLTAAQ